MKKILIAMTFLTATAAYAMCTTNTAFAPDGRMVVCTTCCDANGSNCITNCY